jgi:hypothetical protein
MCGRRDACRSNDMSAELVKPMKGCPIGMSQHRLARVDLHGEWRILVKMVGGLSFLVNDNMCCGITDTALMVPGGR